MAATNVSELEVKILYTVEGAAQVESDGGKVVEVIDTVTGSIEDLGTAAGGTKGSIEGVGEAEIAVAQATLDNNSKIQLLVEKLRLLSKQYAEVSSEEGDHSKQLNSIALQYLNVQKSIDGLMFSPEGGNPAIPFENMSAESLTAASKVELLQMKLQSIADEMNKASSSTDDQTKRLVGLALQYNSVSEQIEKMKAAESGSGTAPAFENMSTEAVTSASKAELLQMKLEDLRRQIDECSSSSENQTSKMISLGMQYNSTAAQLEKLRQEEAAQNSSSPAFVNMSADMITSADKAELLRMKLESLRTQLEQCSVSTEDQTTKMISIGMQYNATREQLEKLTQSQEASSKATTAATSRFGKFLAQLKRIAVYRLIRTALREIVQAFSEGTKNLYEWSKLNDADFKASMDNLSTSALYMKNVLGTALAPVIEDIVVPAIYAISDAIAEAVNWMNQLIAILKGESTYTRAIRKQTEFAKATGGAAKELKRMLLGFDEINRLEDNKGGGSSNAIDARGMFETVAVDGSLSGIAEKIDELKLTIKDVVFDWSDLTGEQIFKKVIAGLGMLAGGVTGFLIGGIPGAIVGSLLGLTFSLLADSMIFDNDGETDKEEILSMIVGVLGALAGGVIGFVIGGPAGALIGATLGFGIFASASSMLFKKQEGSSVDVTTTGICEVLGALLGGAIGFAFGGPAGALIGAAVGVGVTMGIMSGVFSNKAGKYDKNKVFALILPTITAILGGAILGAVLGPAGMLIGLTIGMALTFAVLKAEWGDTNKVEQLSVPSPAANPTGVNPTGGYKETITTSGTYTDKFYSGVYGLSGGSSLTPKNKNVITAKASGGFVDQGSMFIAGESGAEFVGNINGKTGVMNSDQFGAVMQPTTEAVYAIGNAIVGAVNNIPVPSVRIGDREIYRATERGRRLAGGSLVEGAR